ncbi:hypothetical protein ACVWZ8_002341 [Arthrobacter sp. UYCu723]
MDRPLKIFDARKIAVLVNLGCNASTLEHVEEQR